MLDTDTKRRIDTARDILVGKVPDPKSQVEQITIALIYKFMDDMDAESEELGGDRQFFTGKFAAYGWSRLMSPSVGGHELIRLYEKGISTMPENQGIPALFRDIFKNAYLPYRDPETLKSFLKIINEFSYDHSEKLGDAFEYLLSVLGSQGDAGQFRTPRHIIDFIVEIIQPKKGEVILDPACGTAGFLISAYKHILRNNRDANNISTLTPDEKGRMAKNFLGYDISPDMVRLSLVNLYLHGFNDPHIIEYDTLTSEDRWNQFADVILANPPFMSPKGGIKPHKRFSIKAKRSEVLFVDYIAEHLTPKGRAGIIVPEGIIFQSQTAYKDLRKILVENYLVAVVSLPAGVFNPYSNVKTSILILDKSLAKLSDTVAFFKVENDGFGLGAQRREVTGEQLTQVQIELELYLQAVRNQELTDNFELTLGLVVPKEKIAANGDYNFSGERYREVNSTNSKYKFIPVGEAFQKSNQTVIPESLNGSVTYIGLENITQNTGDIEGNIITENPADIKSMKNVFKPNDILYGKLRPNLNKVWLADRSGICSTDIFVIEAIEGKAHPALGAYLFRSQIFNDTVIGQLKGAQLPRIGWSSFAEIQIPLPPIAIQQEIVTEIESYQKVINGARAVIDNYRPHIPINSDWAMFKLGEICRFIDYRGKTPTKTSSGIPLITAKNVREGYINPEPREFIATEDYDTWMTRGIPKIGDVLFTTEAPLGNVAEINIIERFALAQRLIALCPNREILIGAFLKDLLLSKSLQDKIIAHQSGTTVYGIKASVLKEITVPVPPLEIQKAIVAEIEAEQTLVNANRELITRFEKKIQTTLNRIWGEE
ncbi:N-6 DNA methylase [Planktothrix agardhii 1801]|uniref:N-6 DNA methylase n=1 Tax=Planktothrix agardhii TaxID=1160 RepID=UPI001F26C73E|nr:N-6 DNA methylase [Planktothrix agardhii]MCF3623313.1 N-6 DNA methylase [Planktothrix agardhii 1801]